MDLFGFYTGQEFEAYQYLGAHTIWQGGTVFRTFAPSAVSIGVIGEFNHWQESPMQKVLDGNFWELTVPEAKEGMMYKFRIHYRDGRVIDHCDPYGFFAELRPASASVISTLREEEFT
ncbi:MAG: glycogen-branching enzyme, partial [Lachnospiraceae bacterium]|nr:glycogen-branching enzyme [Lachnospiraceae bacterium]